ncbi:TetR/AcrR family transcriptional regulator [Aquihabitans sp. McL0605]|uniref:TetR/AcrR family transcriptional regulator n=1 Tax=Aquihabitans sp. McL0605 TaxID=3415671 RepID=UPI003CF8C48D
MARTATPADEDATAGPGRRTGLDRDDVVTAALDLVEREGAPALSMRRLATELDVATPTIYWHVGSRDELVAAVIRLQSNRLAEHTISGATPRERVFSAARHIWTSSIEHRAITSLAHQAGMSSLLAHHLEAAVVTELEASGLVGQEAADATRAILITVGGSLLLVLRDLSTHPPESRPDSLWADSDASITDETRAALRAEPDLDAVSAVALRAVIDHYVPA